jgi:hypothetical protein
MGSFLVDGRTGRRADRDPTAVGKRGGRMVRNGGCRYGRRVIEGGGEDCSIGMSSKESNEMREGFQERCLKGEVTEDGLSLGRRGQR